VAGRQVVERRTCVSWACDAPWSSCCKTMEFSWSFSDSLRGFETIVLCSWTVVDLL
jgi:hypothetical protein